MNKVFIGAVESKKIDLQNFNKTDLIARLFTIQRNWTSLPQNVRSNKTKAKSWAKKTLKENFKYPEKYFEPLYTDLLIFLLGDDDNTFTKTINR